MNRLFATTKARVLLAVIIGVAMGAGIGLPRIVFAAKTVSVIPANVNAQEQQAGTSSVTVTFQLGEDNPAAVSATYTTANDTATAGEDYVAQSGTVDFAPHQTSKQVVFTIKGDTIDEPNEVFKIDVTGASPAGWTAGTDGTVTILDDDQPPAVSIDDKTQDEGNGSSSTMNFTVRLSSPAGANTTFYAFTKDPRDPAPLDPTINAPLAATPGTALNTPAGADYASLNTGATTGTAVTVNKGNTTADLPVTIFGGLVDEHDQHFEVVLRDTNNSAVAELDFATGKIKDDDALARIDVSDPAPVLEGDQSCGPPSPTACTAQITFTVTKTGDTEKTARVEFATANRSATSTADYVGESGTHDPDVEEFDTDLHFPPSYPNNPVQANQTSQTIVVGIRGDDIPEPFERFALDLSNVVDGELGDAQAFGLIQDDDGGSFPTVSIANAADTAEETGTTDGTVTFTITVSRPVHVPPEPADTANVQVFYATADGHENGTGSGASAVAGSDYVATTGSVTITFPATTATVNVPLIDNETNEPDEFFQLQLTDASNASITDAIGQAKITDDDPAPTLSIADKTQAEGTSATPTTAAMTVTLSGASGQTVTVDCSTPQPNSGTATATGANADYTPITGQTIVFVPGDTSETCNIPVTADAVDENNETVAVALSNATGGVTINDGSATLTITDDDNPPTVSIANTVVTEGSSTNPEATFVVSLSGPSSKTITVNVATPQPNSGTATPSTDYTTKSETLTFTPGDTSEEFKVTVIADTLDEADETFTAEMTSPSNATLGTPSTATATIEDDDDSPTIAINNATVTEGNSGTVNAAFTVTLSMTSAQTITVQFATADGTAMQPSDYTQTNGTLTFVPGDTSETINVPVKGDTAVEVDEIFNVNLTSPTNATLADASGTGTITNDEGVVPTTSTSTTTTSTTTTTLPGSATPKFLTGPGPGGGPHIRTFSATGNPASTDFFDGSDTVGKRVAMGDVNGDGFDEIITGTGPNAAAVLSVYGANEQLIASTFPYSNGNWFGGIFVAAGDVDGDGKAEVITSVGPGGGPHVKVWKVVNNTLVEIAGFYAYTNAQGQPNWNGGVTIASGNLDADANWEIVTGVGAGGGPHVKVFDVTVANNVMSFAEKFGFYAYTNAQGQPNWNGGVNVAAGDLDNDGKAEIATTPWAGGGAHLRLFNNNNTLRHGGIIAAADPAFNGGLTVAMGDLNGDGIAEIAVASMTKAAGVRTYKADLTSHGVNFTAYPNFTGGVWAAMGRTA